VNLCLSPAKYEPVSKSEPGSDDDRSQKDSERKERLPHFLHLWFPPEAGCRKIAQIFNRRFVVARRTPVGKTLVSELIRQQRYEIDVLRGQIKRAKPCLVPKNLIWAVDLTGKATLDGETPFVLGILEHVSRAAQAYFVMLNPCLPRACALILKKSARYRFKIARRTSGQNNFDLQQTGPQPANGRLATLWGPFVSR
jgi:hypothetical protein